MSLTNHRKGIKTSHLPQPAKFGAKVKKGVRTFQKSDAMTRKAYGKKK
jgi:hypothetical protein